MKCEYCDTEHDGSYASGRFCSSKCARGFSSKERRLERNYKISLKMRGKIPLHHWENGYKWSSTSIEKRNTTKYEKYIYLWKSGRLSGYTGKKIISLSAYVEKYIFNKFNHRCRQCGISSTNPFSGKSILEINHIDGNYLNCQEDNLELLCPNCHAMTSTFRNLNKGRGRKFRIAAVAQ
jgi:hypothetical protein